MRQRTLTPAITPDELHEADTVFRHAERRVELHGPFQESKRALVVVKCNQLPPDNAGVCDWSRSIETTVTTAERDGRTAIAEHLRSAHPYLTDNGRKSLVGNAWVNLRDVTGGR